MGIGYLCECVKELHMGQTLAIACKMDIFKINDDNDDVFSAPDASHFQFSDASSA